MRDLSSWLCLPVTYRGRRPSFGVQVTDRDREPLTYLTNSNLALQKKEGNKKRRTNEDEECTKCREAVTIKVKGGFGTFTKHFKYLGSYTLYSFRDDYNIDTCLASGNASMGALAKFWTDVSVKNHSKYLIFFVVPINLLLWGCEIWALRTSLKKNLRYSYITEYDAD